MRALFADAERLGFDSVWAAEAYGSDALTPLAWLGAGTTRVRLGTSILQMAARTPAATAMAAMTMVERVALVGPRAKVAEELTEWRRSLLTTMTVSADAAQLATIAELVRG